MTATPRPAAADRLGRAEGAASAEFERFVFLVFCAFVALVPFWFGSNSLFSWALNAVVAGLLALAYEANLLVRGRSHPVPPGRLPLEILAMAGIVGFILLQIAPGTPAFLHHPIWSVAGDALGRDVGAAISVDPDATALALLRLLTALSVFWLALQLCRDGARAFRLVQAVAVAGLVYALYGVLAETLLPDTILWFEERTYRGYLNSTFVNRNTFATYAGIGIAAAASISLTYFRVASLSGSARFRAARLVEVLAGPGGIFLIACFVLVIALFMTVSRAGITASLAGTLFLVVVAWSRARRGRGVVIVLGLVILALLGVGLNWFAEDYFERLEVVATQGDSRFATFRLVAMSLFDAPLLGFGYGTFRDVFPMYRDDTIGVHGLWEYAHNSYLELFQGLGLVAGTMFLAVLASLICRCILAALRRGRNVTAPLCASGASIIVALHSFADFSVQIQAVTLTWCALLGAGVSQAWSSRDSLAPDA